MNFVVFLTFITFIVVIGLSIAAYVNRIKPIVFSNEFYEGLNYFKFEQVLGQIKAINKDGTSHIIFEGSNGKKIEIYYAQVQLGFEQWLKKQKNIKKYSESKVNFE